MASYLDLTKLMNEKEKQATKLAYELTIKDMINILNNPKSTPAEQEVVVKAAQLLTEAENNYLNRDGNETSEGETDSFVTPNEWLKKAAQDYCMED